MLGVWHTLFQPTLDEIAQLMNLSLHLQVNHLQPCLFKSTIWKRVFWAQLSTDAALPNPQLLKA